MGRDLSSAPGWSAGANDRLTNAVACRLVRCADTSRVKESPGRAGAFMESSMKNASRGAKSLDAAILSQRTNQARHRSRKRPDPPRLRVARGAHDRVSAPF
jgi:hypothetical protein